MQPPPPLRRSAWAGCATCGCGPLKEVPQGFVGLEIEFGRLKGRRIVRGREAECDACYRSRGSSHSRQLNLIPTLPEDSE